MATSKNGLGLREERRLARGHDHEIEKVAPGFHAGCARDVAVERVAHDRVRISPFGIRDEQEPLARLALVEQRQRRLGIENHETIRIGEDLGLELAFHMRFIERRFRAVVEIGVAEDLGNFLSIEQVDELRVHAAFREREQRIEENPAPLREIDDGARIRLSLLLEIQHARPVHRLLDEAEAVGLDEVALLAIDDEAARRALRVEAEILHRPAQREQALS